LLRLLAAACGTRRRFAAMQKVVGHRRASGPSGILCAH